MTKQKWLNRDGFSGNRIYIALATVWSALFFVLAWRTYFADSEIWLLTVSQRTLTPKNLPSVFYKFDFHALTYFFSHFAPDEVSVYLWGRTGWAAIGLLCIWLASRLFSRVHGKNDLLWPLFTFLLTSALFINQGFRIRGDILCLLCHLFYLNTFYDMCENGPRKRTLAYLVLWHIGMIMATPKFILFTICQVALGVSWAGVFRERRKVIISTLLMSTLLPVISGCAGTLLLGLLGYDGPLIAIAGAADFYLKSYDPKLFNPVLFSFVDFYHFTKLYVRSQAHALIFTIWVIAFFIGVFKKKKSTGAAQSLQVYAALLLFLIMFYNQKLPFFLGPFMTPVLAQAFCAIVGAFSSWRPNWRPAFIALVIAGATANGGFSFFINYFFNSNLPQREAIATLDAYTDRHPDLKIYDIVGLVPRKTKVFVFVGPSEVANKSELIDSVLKAEPDLILLVMKFKYLEPEFPPLLEKYWVPLEPGVWGKGRYLSPRYTPLIFAKPIDIQGNGYWLMPYPKEKYIIDNTTHRVIQNETLGLDAERRVTQSNPVYLAVPRSYLSLVLTDIEPIGLKHSPSILFRYDTEF